MSQTTQQYIQCAALFTFQANEGIDKEPIVTMLSDFSPAAAPNDPLAITPKSGELSTAATFEAALRNGSGPNVSDSGTFSYAWDDRNVIPNAQGDTTILLRGVYTVPLSEVQKSYEAAIQSKHPSHGDVVKNYRNLPKILSKFGLK